ncbi:hypothetical protein SAMN02927921_04138 [Sinomicrobium oceani]|uniref:Uncharacterized protein n=2 Tax=Sinomicrobium oceani TaxID=1150368 RepID=A0A1K1RWQ3_9FLAO|nr:hypothetical protein SAMN02927921_04138 [Sinomicrobium oceani]
MLKSMVGKRDNEESYQFSNYQKRKLDIYYGRDNLKNTDTIRKQNHYSLNFIFCFDCEDKLGKIEGKVIPIIQDEIRLDNKKPNYEELSNDEITFKKCLRLDNHLFRLFFYSVIWRFALIYRIEDDIKLISEEKEEELRKILNEFLNKDLNKISSDIPDLAFQVFTADSFEDKTEGTVYSEDIYSDPMICFANEFIIFYYENGYAVKHNYSLPINTLVESEMALNDINDHPKIGFIDNFHFQAINEKMISDAVTAILNSLVKKVCDCTGLSLINSRYNLAKIGMDIHQKTGENLITAFEEAADLICKGEPK